MIADDFGLIEQLAGAFLRKLAPAERRKLLRTIAREERRGQSARIARQENPDGSPFEPRKHRRQGHIRRDAMFRKLRLTRFLKSSATANEASIGFYGRAAQIARVHQLGLLDNPAPGMPQVRYARRVLLGLTDAAQEQALDRILAHCLTSR